MLKRLSIGHRIVVLSLMGLAFALGLGLFSYQLINRMNATADELNRFNKALRAHVEGDMMHEALRGDVLAAVLAANKQHTQERDGLVQETARHSEWFRRLIKDLKSLSLSPDIDTRVARTEQKLNRYIDGATELVALAFTALPAAEAKMPGFLKVFDELEEELEALSTQIEKQSGAVSELNDDLSHRAGWVILLAAGLAAVLLAVFARGIWRSIVVPLQQALRATQAVAAGDLRVRLDTHGQDEAAQLLRSLDSMMASLIDLVSEVRTGACRIETGAGEVASGAAQLSVRNEQQVNGVVRTASSMSQMTRALSQSAETAQQAAKVATTAAEVAAAGGQRVAAVVSTMSDISASSKQIADIIGVIDSIAFQTNILALNAAVEAARAGEQGRGFAVVASEVRALAGRSAEAARQIKTLINDSVTKVEAGSIQVSEAGRVIDALVNEVGQVKGLIGALSTASREQSQGIDDIGSAMAALNEATQGNASLVGDSTNAALALQEQAARLTALAARFQLPER